MSLDSQRLSLRVLLGALSLAAAPVAPTLAAAELAPRLELAPCRLPGIEREVRCGRFDVFEDRAAGKGRKIPLRVAVLPATGAGRVSDPLFFFEGGPGLSAVDDAADLAAEWAAINRRRDIVLIDVRGTGDSNGLQCQALQGHQGVLGFLDSFLPVAGVRSCRKDLEPRANLALYTTTNAVDDVDDVRAALGFDRINISGASYGSFFALNYLRRHGEHVRTAMIEGVVPPNTRMPLYFAKDAQLALDQVLDACAKDAGCHAAFPDLRAELERVLDRLAKAPAEVEVNDPKTGRPLQVQVSRSAVAQALRYALYLPVTAAQIPLQIHLAAQGDLGPIAATAYVFGSMMADTADGFYLSVTCAEDVPFYTLAEAEQAARGTYLRDFRSRTQKAACAEWPRGAVPADFSEPVRSDVPTLLLSGERDPVTPAYWADQAARTLSHSLHLVVKGGGHSLDGLKGAECLDQVFAAFLELGRVEGLDTSCVAKIVPVPFTLKDDRVAAVKLTSEELDRFAGGYSGSNGIELTVRREGDVLQVLFGADQGALTPVSATRFKIEGAPAGFFVEFRVEEGKVTGVVVEEGPSQREVLKRK
jgi:pimeloyl-ACP methyl ester carboxylesterase